MEKKKGLLILTGFLFLNVFMLGIASAEDLCWVETSAATCTATAGNQVIIHISNSTNAHGELESHSPHQYSQVLCCNFGSGSTSCSANNKIIGLSDSTNAHAERPEPGGLYNDNNVCYDSLIGCFTVGAGSNCAGASLKELEVLRLSSITNAHLEVPGLSVQNYDTKICCIVVQAFWSDKDFEEIESLNVVPDLTSVELALENSDFAEGTILDFDIFEKGDSLDTLIRTVTGTADSNGKVVATWVITSGDLTTAIGFEGFYFLVNGLQSGFLTLNVLESIDCAAVITCGDYEQAICESDVCQVAGDSVPGPIDCSDSNVNCFCTQNVNTGCDGAFSYSSPPPLISGDGIISIGETCDGDNWGPITRCSDFDVFTGGNLSCDSTGHFNTSLCTGGTSGVCGDGKVNTGETCDKNDWGPITGCSSFDGFTGGGGLLLSCDTSTCNFNTFLCVGVASAQEIGTCLITQEDADDNGCDDGFLTISWMGQWIWNEDENPGHADPDGLSGLCETGGTRVIECPAQIKLPFFGFYNIIATIFLITIIYFILIRKKNKKN